MAQKFHAQVPPFLPIYANVVTARQQMCRHRISHSGRQATAPRTSNTDVLAVRPARHYHRMLVRSEGLEPPRFYSLPPQGSASTNSATSALGYRLEANGLPDRRRRCNKSGVEGQGGFATQLTT